MKNISFINLKVLVVLTALISSPQSFSGVINYSGIGVNGTVNNIGGIESLAAYEFGLLQLTYLDIDNNYQWYSGNQYKFEKDFINTSMTTYLNGSGEEQIVFNGADYESKQSMRFENIKAADQFADRLDNNGFETELTNAVLNRPQVVNNVSGVLGLTVALEEDQIRSTEASFDYAMYSSDEHGLFAVDYTFSALAYAGTNLRSLTDLLTISITDYLKSSNDSLFDLTSIEQDLHLLTASNDLGEGYMTTSYSQRFWFNDQVSASKALTYFNDDITNKTEAIFRTPGFGGLDIQESSLLLSQHTTEVPEPSTLFIFGVSAIGLIIRTKSKHKAI